MPGDTYSIQELGGEELARHYPDRGSMPDSHWHTAVVRTAPDVTGVWSWFRSFAHCNQFFAVLSANAEGLRVRVRSDEFAIFIPWADATVTAERGSPATVARIRTAGVPHLALEVHLDDAAADDLFRGVIDPLPLRDPPRTLWSVKRLVGSIVLAAVVTAGLWALLSWWK